jgi:uncharacterized membrane protein
MNSTTSTQSQRHHSLAISLNRGIYHVSRTWFFWFLFGSGILVGLPWLAPIFMHLGWEFPAKAIYKIYSFLCHQLPQRSFFLFGPHFMYSLEQIQNAWQHTYDPTILRQFMGNFDLGYKVAWSDRMVSMYTSIPVFALIWRVFRKRIRPLQLWGFILLALPLVIDGGTHMISDVAGIGQGFRYTNSWLAELTNQTLPSTLVRGDALGSFNSWMRLITGVLFSLGFVWIFFPHIQMTFEDLAAQIQTKFSRAGVDL